jgi:hypothetical protein
MLVKANASAGSDVKEISGTVTINGKPCEKGNKYGSTK